MIHAQCVGMSIDSGGNRDRWWPLSRLQPSAPCTFRSWVGIDTRSPEGERHHIVATKQREDEPTEPFPLQEIEPRMRRKSWPPAFLADIARSAGRRLTNRPPSENDAT